MISQIENLEHLCSIALGEPFAFLGELKHHVDNNTANVDDHDKVKWKDFITRAYNDGIANFDMMVEIIQTEGPPPPPQQQHQQQQPHHDTVYNNMQQDPSYVYPQQQYNPLAPHGYYYAGPPGSINPRPPPYGGSAPVMSLPAPMMTPQVNGSPIPSLHHANVMQSMPQPLLSLPLSSLQSLPSMPPSGQPAAPSSPHSPQTSRGSGRSRSVASTPPHSPSNNPSA